MLGKYGGILSLAEANAWLASGNYRLLDEEEVSRLQAAGIDWPDLFAEHPGSDGYPAFLAPPLPFQAIVGRESILADLKNKLLDRETITLSAVRGLPGVGKTTVALALAHDQDIRQTFTGGVFWVGLGRDPDVFFHLGLWGRELGLDTKALENLPAIGMRAEAIRSFLSSRKALVIIDDVWQARNALLFQLGGQDCAHIVTTRQPQIANEFTNAVHIAVETLSLDDSIRLLADLAPQAAASFPDAFRDLARSSAGLPLALILVGNHLRKLDLTGQRRRLEQAIADLQSKRFLFDVDMPQVGSHAHPSLDRDQAISLGNIVGISLDALEDPAAKSALYSLGVFPSKPSSFSEAAALAVMETEIEALDDLVDAGLVDASGRSRYQIHQSISDFIQTREVPEIAQQRFVTYFSDWLSGDPQEDASIERELDNVLAAAGTADKTGLSGAYVSLVRGLYPYLEKRAHWEMVNQLVPTAIDHAGRTGDYEAQVSLYRSWGRASEQQRDREKADTYWQKALQIARDRHFDEVLVDLLTELSLAASSKNAFEKAHQYLVEAREAAKNSGYTRGLCLALGYLGRLHNELGEYQESITALDESIRLARENDLHFVLGGLFNLRGVAARNVESEDAAVEFFLQGLKHARENRRKDQVGLILTNLGEVEALRGKESDAASYLDEALAIAQETGNRAREAHVRKDLGILAMQRGDRSSALYSFEKALELAKDGTWLTAYIRVHRGELLLETDQEKAESELREIIEGSSNEGKNRFIHAIARFGLARIAAARGELAQAVQLAEESRMILGEIEHIREAEVQDWIRKLQPGD